MENGIKQKDALTIIICQEPEADGHMVEQIQYGIEEEGMPSFTLKRPGGSLELSYYAAESSQLGIGIGVDRAGLVTLNQVHMPKETFVIQASLREGAQTARIIGSNAARLFKGIPFLKMQ
jgi:hypothetical protein